ncbi:MAG: CHAT domain-containing protein [Planctomycetota bacterium]
MPIPEAVHPTAVALEEALDGFYEGDPSATADRWEDYRTSVRIANEWLDDVEPPLSESDLDIAERVADVAVMLGTTVGGWTEDPATAVEFNMRWLEALAADVDVSGAVGRKLYGRELRWQVETIADWAGKSAAVEMLGDETLEIVESLDPHSLLACLAFRADCRRLLGDFRGAYADLARCDAARSGEGNTWETEYSIHAIRLKLELDLGRFDQAKGALSQLVRLAETAESEHHKLSATTHRVRYLLEAGEYAAVRAIVEPIVEYYDSRDEVDWLVQRELRSLMVLDAIAGGYISDEPDALREAEAQMRSALDGESMAPAENVLLYRIQLASLTIRTGDLEAAQRELDRLIEGLDPEGIYADSLFRARVEARQLELAIAMHAYGSPERIEAARALERRLDDLVDSWRAIDVPGGVGFLHFPEWLHIVSLLIDETLDGSPESNARALDLALAVDGCASIPSQRGALSLRAEELVRACGETSSAVVAYIPSRTSTHCFLVDASGVHHTRMKSTGELEATLAELQRSLRRPPTGDTSSWLPPPLARAVEDLSRTLVPDAIREDPTAFTSIHFMAKGALASTPFEVLPCANGLPIGLATSVARLPSAVLVGADARPSDGEHEGTARLFRLESSDRVDVGIDLRESELERLRDGIGPYAVIDANHPATASAFLDDATSGADLFIAWTHGVTDYAEPIPAGVLVIDETSASSQPRKSARSGNPEGTTRLGGEQISDALQRAGTASAPDVVFLAACNTAVGHLRIGDESASNLGGVFLGAGSRAAVVADRLVEREAAFVFLESFAASYVGEGRTAGASMLEARKRLAADERFSSPHFWAAFQLLGWSNARVADR